MGAVSLTVRDAGRAREFYERVVGLRALEGPGDSVRLGAGDEENTLVELNGRPDAPQRPPGTTGLFHLAIVVPTRRDLARALRRVVEAGWSLAGASDHLVSEALYLSDPDGNGIEVYRDRPREQWSREDGMLRMATLPLDLRDLAAEDAESRSEPAMAAGTRIGHVHLQVGDLGEAEAFYAGTLGFEVTVRGYPGALFVAAGGYHHHVGLNTWAGAGAPPPPLGSVGLRTFEVLLPGGEELERVLERAEAAGAYVERNESHALVPDPSGNTIALRSLTAPRTWGRTGV